MKEKCTGIHRSPKGDQLLTLLVTDRDSDLVKSTVLRMREEVPAYVSLTDDQVIERLVELVAKIPKSCPECGDDQSD